ncbi:MAG TPA: hypothetical protein PLR06_01950 [Cyclobacteriaceae bacterium]|nr:hypothetical protein [Cyclobacteriaceae bacterium]
MNNFELIDDYLTNRLQEQDRKAFEQQLEGDSALREELELQKQIVEGVKQARTVELKAMLNNVPVGGGSWSGGQIAAGIVSAGIIATSLYFYFNEDEAIVKNTEEIQQQIVQPENDQDKGGQPEAIPSDESNGKEVEETGDISTGKAEINAKKKVSKPVQKPNIQVEDPSEELTEENTENVSPGRTAISTSKMEVITETGDKKHNFHYQFVQGKLLLYGPFDKSLYEILEIHGDGHAVFLFYRENYYMLDEKQTKITQLGAIQDTELLKKLKEYRGR